MNTLYSFIYYICVAIIIFKISLWFNIVSCLSFINILGNLVNIILAIFVN